MLSNRLDASAANLLSQSLLCRKLRPRDYAASVENYSLFEPCDKARDPPHRGYTVWRVAIAAVTRYEKMVRFCALCGPTLRSSGLWRIPRSVHITLTSAMAVQAISARDTHHRHAQSRCSAHRIPPTRMSFCSSTARSAHRHTTKLNSRTDNMMLRAAICQE